MSIVDHNSAPEVTWRPEYKRFLLGGEESGFTCTLDLHVVEPGSGAPPHYHQADEFLVVVEGSVEATLGDETQEIGKDHTIAVPAGAHHGFTVVGDSPAKILVFFPVTDPFSDKITTYL